MITHNFNTLDLLTSPVWIVSPFEEQLIYANSEARLLMQDLTFSQLRTGPYSVSSQKELPKYLSDLQNQHDIIEILTVQRKEDNASQNNTDRYHPNKLFFRNYHHSLHRIYPETCIRHI